MYIFYSGPNNCYAHAGVSRRNGSDTSVETIYLGRVLDREAGIYKNKEKGVFTFDPKTGAYGAVPEGYFPPEYCDRRQKGPSIAVDFGDAYFMNEFLRDSGMMDVIGQIEYGNRDTLHSMILFYMLSALANRDAIHWYEGSIARLLYPDANLTSQRISDFLASIGTPEKQMVFRKAYISYVMQHYDPDKNILSVFHHEVISNENTSCRRADARGQFHVDSSGLPNSIHTPLTARNIHNGKIRNEIRIIFVVQKSTGLPLYYRAVPGNIVDVSTLPGIFLHLESMGVEISSCIMDAGYNSGDNLDLFYGEDGRCKIGFITRVGAKDEVFKRMVRKELADLDRKEYFVKYEDRYLFLKKKKVMVGSRKDHPAWMYLGLDCSRMSDEQRKLFKRAKSNSMSTEDVFDCRQTEGLFGILSGEDYSCEEILPAYYQRQAAEQIFDFEENDTKLLPLRTSNEDTLQGHLLLSYVASIVVKMIQMKRKETDLFLGSRLACLRNQKCTIYPFRIVTDEPQKVANDTYKAIGIKCPDSIGIQDGKLLRLTPDVKGKDAGTVGRKKAQKNTKAENESPKRRGRPAGSKNKKTIEREAEQVRDVVVPVMRGRGRPADRVFQLRITA